MIALDALPADILHQIVELCSKADLLSLRLTSRGLSDFLTLFLDKCLVSEIRQGRHTHLHRAIATSADYGRLMVARLLQASAPVNQRDRNAEIALHVASRLGNFDGAYSLLDAGSDVDALSKQQWTPLRLACRYGHSETTRMLLESGADVNQTGLFGWTALQFAAQNGHTDCVKVLVEYGATENVCHQGSRSTPVKEGKQQWGIYRFSMQL